MRPLELRVRNFRSYAGEHTIDFRDRSLLAIVGPTGSGKSSILDAIAFALYGRTPRIGSATKTLINQRASDSSVVLRFVVDGGVWEVARSIRSRGPSKHALYRYEADEVGAEPVEKIVLEGEVNQQIIELLGLDFSAFERSVLLAQGRFAEFLQARPADRDKVLKGVFGHDRIDRMRALAKERQEAASHELEKLAIRLEKLDEVKEMATRQQVELGEARKRAKRLARAAARLSKIDETAAAATAAAQAARKRLADLEQHAGRLPQEAATKQVLVEAQAAAKRRSSVAKTLDLAQARLRTAEKALAAASRAGEPELVQRAARLLAAADPQLKAVVDADRRIASFVELVETTADGATRAEKLLEEAEHARDITLGRVIEAAKILEEAEAALERGRHADMAATLRVELELGNDCPVCAQPVHELPPAAGVAHIDKLENVLVAAQSTKNELDEAHTAALGALERAREQLNAARERSETAKVQLAGAEKDAMRVRGDLEETTMQLAKILGPGDPSDQLERRRSAYETLVAEREEAQSVADRERGLHDQSIRDEQTAGKALQDLGMRLAELATRLEVDIEVGDDARALGESFDQLRAQWQQITTSLHHDRDSAERTLREQRAEREEMLSDLGVDTDVSTEVAVLADRIDRLEQSLVGAKEQIEHAAQLFAEKEKLADAIELFGRINSDLTDSRFVRYLLDEERSRLAELGSEHFQQLSAGRYRFADDQFAILDLTAADATRRPDSLSGGETFLASLALALALAEMVAGTGGRLDAFFLDEGFGTLDPEHLDLAMEGVEQLVVGNSDRLVVIVSHVPELRMRVEDLIVLDRNAVTGDTRVVAS